MTQSTHKDSPQSTISTSAEAVENAILPMVHEVHKNPDTPCAMDSELPENFQYSEDKSEARWAYERLILYIQNFEKQLKKDEEVALGFTGGEAGVVRIEGLGYFDPDILTFYGTTDDGARTQLVQHVSQLNVMLIALPAEEEIEEPDRIGFRLARELETPADATKHTTSKA